LVIISYLQTGLFVLSVHFGLYINYPVTEWITVRHGYKTSVAVRAIKKGTMIEAA